MSVLSRLDPEVAGIIEDERTRQVESLEMIASENYASAAVLEATGSVFTNKYAEGYPGKRYYAGNQHSDRLEELAIARAKELFGAEHANVQPTSGAEANMAVYQAFVNPGDTIMGMELSQGGHLTHGSPVNFSGRLYNFVPYTVDRETEIIDLAEVKRLAHETKPKIIVAGATAYPRAIDFAAFGEIARGAGALLMIFLAGLMIAAIFILWFSLLIRKALLLVAIVLGPIALAGLTWEASRGWFGKWATFVVALIASKLVVTVIFLVALSQVATPLALDLAVLSEPIAGIVFSW